MMDRKLLYKKHYLYSHGAAGIRVQTKIIERNGMTSRKRNMKRKSIRRRGRRVGNITFSFSFAESIEGEQIKMNDTKQMKARETITHWQELMVVAVMAMPVVVATKKKSSSSSRLVIYFSVITQTFKRTHTIHPSIHIYIRTYTYACKNIVTSENGWQS